MINLNHNEGRKLKNGFNFYQKGNGHSRGFIFRLPLPGSYWAIMVRFSVRLNKWLFRSHLVSSEPIVWDDIPPAKYFSTSFKEKHYKVKHES
jgi:hypothetical protein